MLRLSVLSISVVLVATVIELSPVVSGSEIDKMLSYILHSKGLEPGSKCHKKTGWKFGNWDKGHGWQYGEHEFCDPPTFEDAFLDLFYKVFHIKEKEAKQELKTAKVELKTEKVHAKTEKIEHKKPEHHEEHGHGGGHQFADFGHGFEGLGSELHGYAALDQGFGGFGGQGFGDLGHGLGHGAVEQPKGHDDKGKEKEHQENRGGLFGGGLFGRGRGLFGSNSNHQPVHDQGHNQQHGNGHNQHGTGLVGLINTMSAFGANFQAGLRNANPLNGIGGGGPLGGVGGGLGGLAGFVPGNDNKGDLIIMPDQHAFYPNYALPNQ